jgi:hypothetical protein
MRMLIDTFAIAAVVFGLWLGWWYVMPGSLAWTGFLALATLASAYVFLWLPVRLVLAVIKRLER